MIENLNGTHETVNYRENTNLRIYDNVEYEEYPLHWHSPIEILMPVRSEYVFEYNDALIRAAVKRDVVDTCSGSADREKVVGEIHVVHLE